MRITISEIAKLANVSIATVSRVVNNKAEGVSDAKRQEIKKLIAKYNYQPNALARSMVTKKSNTVGFIIPDIENPFFPGMARGVEDAAVKKGYTVFLCNSDGKISKESDYIMTLYEKRVDGLILAPTGTDSEDNIESILRESTLPIVIVDEPVYIGGSYGVFCDDEKGGYMATKHLIDLGHKSIACITGPDTSASAHKRVKGYIRALEEASIPVNNDWIVFGGYNYEHGLKTTDAIRRSNSPTAIFAANDLIAYGVYQSLQNSGLAIPDDFSVVGFDNLLASNFLTPGLTTINQDAYSLGLRAAEVLFSILEKQPAKSKVTWFDPTLVERKSTCPPRNS